MRLQTKPERIHITNTNAVIVLNGSSSKRITSYYETYQLLHVVGDILKSLIKINLVYVTSTWVPLKPHQAKFIKHLYIKWLSCLMWPTLMPDCRMEMGKLGSGFELSHRRNWGSTSASGLLKLKWRQIHIIHNDGLLHIHIHIYT